MKPKNWTWSGMGWGAPQSIPREVPDADRTEKVLLTDRYGRPLIIKQARPIGFRPPR